MIPPDCTRKHVSRSELETRFDQALREELRLIMPRAPNSFAARPEMSYPPGSFILPCYFVDDATGYDVALADRHMTLTGEELGGRKYHPTGLYVAATNEWLYV
jgi:hypothetical protein